MRLLDHFREVILCDFEFISRPGERQIPVCMVAKELRSGRQLRIWEDQFGPDPPFGTGPDTLFVSYFASAELGCFRALNWPMPMRVLDPFTEFRNLTNGWPTIAGNSLQRVLRGGPWLPGEPQAILSVTANRTSLPWSGCCRPWSRVSI